MRKKMHQTGKFFSFILLGLGCLCLISGGILIGRQMSATPKAESSAPEEVPYEQEKITDAEVTGEFYYEQLSDEEQTVYREILQGIQENKKEIYLHCSNANTANEVFQNVLNDRPEIFWCDGNATSTEYSQSEGQSRYVVIEPNYLYEGEEKEQRYQEIESARATCLSGISDLSDEYEKIKYIYTYLINNVDYDLDAPDNQNIYSALVGKRSVCAGYAKSCQYLLQQLGIYCIYVTGQTTDPNGGIADHAWNIVQCNGQYYYVDATWGDPIFLGEDNGYQIPNLIAYDYLCCSEKELEKTHMISTDYVYPSCQSENLNYYQLNGMYYDTYEPGILREVIDRSIESQEAYTIFKMSDDAVYQEVVDEMHETLMEEGAGYLGELYGLWQVSYSYSEEVSLNKFIIYWFYE